MKENIETVKDSAIDKEYLRLKLRMYARILTESTILSKREGHSPEDHLDPYADNLCPQKGATAE